MRTPALPRAKAVVVVEDRDSLRARKLLIGLPPAVAMKGQQKERPGFEAQGPAWHPHPPTSQLSCVWGSGERPEASTSGHVL